MKKKLITLCSLIVITFTAFSVICYWQVRTRLPELLKMALESARAKGIDISFQQMVPPQDAVLDLRELKLRGQALPVAVSADSIKVRISIRPSLRPLSITLAINHPSIMAQEMEKPQEIERVSNQPSQKPPALLATALLLCQLRIDVSDLEAVPWGIKKAHGSISTRDLSFSWSNWPSLTIEQHLELVSLTHPKLSLLPKMTSEGLTTFQYPTLTMTKTNTSIGPIQIRTEGKYDLITQKWNLDLEMPKISFNPSELSQLATAIEGLKSAQGSIYFRLSSQGLGSDLNSVYSDGELKADQVNLEINRKDLAGNVALNISTTFAKKDALVIDSNFNLNLDDSLILIENKFKKPRKTPLNAHLTISGKNDQFLIQNGELNFNNLAAKFKGSILNGPKVSTKIDVSVAKTSLSGWEQFVPSLTDVKASGFFQGDITYAGTLDNWKLATIDLALKAKDIEFPILKDWISNKELTLSGSTKINTETKISISQGSLRTMTTNTDLNFTQNQIAFSDMFSKPSGVPLSAKVNVKSSATEAQIQDSSIVLGAVHGTLNGKISNFLNPVAQLKLKTAAVPCKELLPFSPLLKEYPVRLIRGTVETNGSVSGPLLSKTTLPVIKLDATIAKLDFDYQTDTKSSVLEVRELQGKLGSTFGANGLSEIKLDPFNFRLFQGELGMKLSCKGPLSSTKCTQRLDIKHLAADRALEFMSPKSKGLVRGKIDSHFEGEFTGLNSDAVKKTLVGAGSVTLHDGEFMAVNLIEKPIESLKKLPLISNMVHHNVNNQPIKQTTANFQFKDGKTVFSDLKMSSPYFDLSSKVLTIDTDQNLFAKLNWIPKESALGRQVVDMLKDESGTPSVPLTVSGPLTQPVVSIDEGIIQARLANHAKKVAEAAANRGLSDFKNKVGNSIEKQLKKGIEGLFKR